MHYDNKKTQNAHLMTQEHPKKPNCILYKICQQFDSINDETVSSLESKSGESTQRNPDSSFVSSN